MPKRKASALEEDGQLASSSSAANGTVTGNGADAVAPEGGGGPLAKRPRLHEADGHDGSAAGADAPPAQEPSGSAVKGKKANDGEEADAPATKKSKTNQKEEGEGEEGDEEDEDGDEDEDDDDDDDDDDEDDDEEEEEEIEKKVLPQRSTRGQRSTRLVGEAAEADEEFWNQDAFQSDDSDFSLDSEEDTSSESTDPDIDIPEPDAEEDENAKKKGGAAASSSSSSSSAAAEAEADDDDGGGKKRGGAAATGSAASNVYQDKAAAAAKAGKGSLGAEAAQAMEHLKRVNAKGGKSKSRDAALLAASGLGLTPEEIEAALRGDTVDGLGILDKVRARRASAGAALTATATPAAETTGKAATAVAKGQQQAGAGGAAAQPAAPKEPQLTQAEVLIEAAQTALENERLLANAILKAQAAAAAGLADASGGSSSSSSTSGDKGGRSLPPGVPALRYLSRRGAPDVLTFSGDRVEDFPLQINAKQGPNGLVISGSANSSNFNAATDAYPKPKLCAMTGKPAPYLAPRQPPSHAPNASPSTASSTGAVYSSTLPGHAPGTVHSTLYAGATPYSDAASYKALFGSGAALAAAAFAALGSSGSSGGSGITAGAGGAGGMRGVASMY